MDVSQLNYSPTWKTQQSRRRLDVHRCSNHSRCAARYKMCTVFLQRAIKHQSTSLIDVWAVVGSVFSSCVKKTKQPKNGEKKTLFQAKSKWWNLGKQETVMRTLCCSPRLRCTKLIIPCILQVQSGKYCKLLCLLLCYSLIKGPIFYLFSNDYY